MPATVHPCALPTLCAGLAYATVEVNPPALRAMGGLPPLIKRHDACAALGGVELVIGCCPVAGVATGPH